MTDQHPITPPWALVEQWANSSPLQHSDEWWVYELHIAHHAARWGADQLRAARRPKPPSLAEEALAKTEAILNDPGRVLLTEVREALELNRRALKRLQELEHNG